MNRAPFPDICFLQDAWARLFRNGISVDIITYKVRALRRDNPQATSSRRASPNYSLVEPQDPVYILGTRIFFQWTVLWCKG